jgi:hypothetical protein
VQILALRLKINLSAKNGFQLKINNKKKELANYLGSRQQYYIINPFFYKMKFI